MSLDDTNILMCNDRYRRIRHQVIALDASSFCDFPFCANPGGGYTYYACVLFSLFIFICLFKDGCKILVTQEGPYLRSHTSSSSSVHMYLE